MALDVRDALVSGLDRTLERNGLILVGAFVGVKLASLVTTQTLGRANVALLREMGAGSGTPTGPGLPPGLDELPFDRFVGPTPFALPVDLGTALALVLVVAVLAETARIVAVRTLVSDRTDTVPAAFVWDDIAGTTITAFAAGIAVLVLSTIGLALLVLPGIVVALSLLFVRQEIAVEGRGIVGAITGSWGLASGNRLPLLGLAIAIVLVEVATSVPTAVVGIASPAAAAILGAIVSAATTVFGTAVVSRAYVQLREERGRRRELLAGPEGPAGDEWSTD